MPRSITQAIFQHTVRSIVRSGSIVSEFNSRKTRVQCVDFARRYSDDENLSFAAFVGIDRLLLLFARTAH
jgi:hypothetical protein